MSACGVPAYSWTRLETIADGLGRRPGQCAGQGVEDVGLGRLDHCIVERRRIHARGEAR
jgi:hypothetical protein